MKTGDDRAGNLPRKGYCRSCSARVLWALTEKGKWMPLSFSTERTLGIGERPQRGEMAIGPDYIVRGAKLTDFGRKVYKSHHSDCPQAAEHRRPRP